MDVAGLALGALPLIVEAVKSYRIVYEKIKTFRHWAREVTHVQKRLRVQKRLFENECALLLGSVVKNQEEVDTILDVGLDVSDTGNAHSERLQQHLGYENYQCLSDIVGEMLEHLRAIQSDLQLFETQNCKPGSMELVKRRVSDLRNAVTIAFEKNVYLKKIRNLAELCEELRILRSQLSDNDAQFGGIVTSKRPSNREVLDRFRAVREASATLHEAFANAWPSSCVEATHSQHKTILCVDAEVNDYVRLDLAVSYECLMLNRQVSLLILSIERLSPKALHSDEPPIWLYVRSTTTENEHNRVAGKRKLEYTHANPCSLLPSKDLGVHPPQKPLKLAPGLNGTCAKNLEKASDRQHKQISMMKRQKKHALADDNKVAFRVWDNNQAFDGMEPQSMPDTARNLCKMKNLCQHFKHHTCISQNEERCLGFLQSEKAFRHFLYSAATKHPKPAGMAQQTPVTLIDVVQCETPSIISVPQLLQIAHKLALVVLQYQSTPWLRSEWELEDLGLFLNDDDIADTMLSTLHLSANFPNQKQTASSGQILSDVDMAISTHDESTSAEGLKQRGSLSKNNVDHQTHQALLYGVENMTLCSLGIALLQISHRKPLQELRREHEPNNLYTARRVAAGANPLGAKFQRIIQKCLRCDFGSGADLESTELQSAVFNDVACELEDMIAKLTL
ncbi:MAG: hypothetical protein M1821_001286 [Bathelium mastoideum]|nr:MAG: hypothetical protein M1821_001286 [Bathelium mastoideum]